MKTARQLYIDNRSINVAWMSRLNEPEAANSTSRYSNNASVPSWEAAVRPGSWPPRYRAAGAGLYGLYPAIGAGQRVEWCLSIYERFDWRCQRDENRRMKTGGYDIPYDTAFQCRKKPSLSIKNYSYIMFWEFIKPPTVFVRASIMLNITSKAKKKVICQYKDELTP